MTSRSSLSPAHGVEDEPHRFQPDQRERGDGIERAPPAEALDERQRAERGGAGGELEDPERGGHAEERERVERPG